MMKATVRMSKANDWNNMILKATDSGVTTFMRLDRGDALSLYQQFALKDLSDNDHGELTVVNKGLKYTLEEAMWRTIFCALDGWFESYMIQAYSDELTHPNKSKGGKDGSDSE